MQEFSKYIELAKICKLTYAAPINHKLLTIEGENLKFQKIVHGSFGRGFCRIFWSNSNLIIAFRGTREKADWAVSNLKLWPVPFKKSSNFKKSFLVHYGFQNTLDYIDKTTKTSAFNSILHHIKENDLLKKDNIYITGHSLGGALAKLFISRLFENQKEVLLTKHIEVVVFGAPAVGFKAFREYFNNNFKKTTRIVNGSDIVPFTPPLFYRHVGKEIWLNKDEIRRNNSWLNRLLYSLKLPMSKFSQDHSINKYIQNLEKAAHNKVQ